jgi:alkanesulfonate monooxygenase SsuD/methylene tetrahydromethanopterin reductase-like flavin-dependent oxidoreductase (luciferase family)
MRIGLVNELHGRPNGDVPAPSWASIRERSAAAEAAGFDVFVFEDALLYRGAEHTDGVWESMSIAAALAATTTTIEIGQSVVNSPYRSPALTARMAETIDEISGGRYVLGIGAGNTADSDYEAFGFPTDHRYSRFAEAIEIIHGLLKTGTVDFAGEYASARDAELVLRGPRPQGPPVNIAAGSPKMLALAARYGDQWNWWGYDKPVDGIADDLRLLLEALDLSCEQQGRDPASLVRTLDLYSVVPDGTGADPRAAGMSHPVTGSHEEIAAQILSFGELGISEVRCDLYPKTTAAIEAMAPVVALVHAG